MDYQELFKKSNFLVNEFSKKVHKKAKGKDASCTDVKIVDEGNKLSMLFNINNSIIKMTYSKNGMLIVSSMSFKSKKDEALPMIAETLDPVFGRPTVGYSADINRDIVIRVKCLEWAQKGMEAQTVREVRAGSGLEPYSKVYDIIDYTKTDESIK